METAINSYFAKEENKTNPTVTGLAHFLGFESRQSIYDYKERGEFSYIVKRALLLIENAMEKRCGENCNCAGAIFRLKNHGWSDKSEVEHTGLPVPPATLTVTIAKD
jgi:hypothetical protein